jgi:hypothetical protein
VPIKIFSNINDIRRNLISKKIKQFYLKEVNDFIKDEVLRSIESGRSPVDVKPLRYDKYSPSYTDQIKKKQLGDKKQRPINLKLSGTMLRSIKSRLTINYVRVWFSDAKAKYHDKLGAGKSKVVRRMIPDPEKGENFNAGIRRRLKKAMQDAVAKYVRSRR